MTTIASPWTKDGTYIIECTRRDHSCCRSCDDKIDVGRLRVGVVYQHKNGYVCINWHHVECYPEVCYVPERNLEGYWELDVAHQEMLQRWKTDQTSPVSPTSAVTPVITEMPAATAPVEAVRVRHSTSPAALARVPCPADAHASARAREVIVMAAMSQQSSHEEKFRVYNDALLHAATCRDPQCTQEQNRCRKVKASIDHFVRCYGPRRKISPIESCAACGKIWQLLCYHAKTCPTPPSGHCVVSQCDYLREKIARKQARDQSELQQARDSLKSKLEEWPVQRRIAQVEADRLQVLQIIAEIRAQKAARQQPQMMSIG
ncbi:TPA: hypothetical protein N0F65_000191 [Lagenidium giganteum]|uniref:histone acetyltransferase n=1 Tax=Lagenidium giganteum TaxID=4803 RepID=A0AAV2Y9X6_9STRA|nr:TPA: hypothetical protein N0F65_000191 [Lagenidium giganteum]